VVRVPQVGNRCPRGFYAQIIRRFSLTTIDVYMSNITFDHSYHGTIRVRILNDGQHDYPIAIGDMIAEILIMPLNNQVCVHRNLFEDLENPESIMMLADLPDLSVVDPEALQM
jgi:dUTPase